MKTYYVKVRTGKRWRSAVVRADDSEAACNIVSRELVLRYPSYAGQRAEYTVFPVDLDCIPQPTATTEGTNNV